MSELVPKLVNALEECLSWLDGGNAEVWPPQEGRPTSRWEDEHRLVDQAKAVGANHPLTLTVDEAAKAVEAAEEELRGVTCLDDDTDSGEQTLSEVASVSYWENYEGLSPEQRQLAQRVCLLHYERAIGRA